MRAFATGVPLPRIDSLRGESSGFEPCQSQSLSVAGPLLAHRVTQGDFRDFLCCSLLNFVVVDFRDGLSTITRPSLAG